MNIQVTVDAVGIRVYGDEHIFFQCIWQPGPVDVQPAGMRIQLYHHVVGGTGVDDRFMIYRVAVAAQEQAAGHMPQDGGIGIFDGFQQAGHCFFLRHLQVGVHGSDHQVKFGQYLIGVVQCAIVEDIGFYALENAEWRQLFIEGVDLFMLCQHSFNGKAVSVKGRPGVVADHEVFKSLRFGGGGHFFQGRFAVAPAAVRVDDAFDIAGRYYLRELLLPGQRQFIETFPQEGRYICHARGVENGFFRRGIVHESGAAAGIELVHEGR